MSLLSLVKVSVAVEAIHNETGCSIPDIVDALTGICWDEEEAYEIKGFHSDESAV